MSKKKTVISIYTLSIGTPKCINQILIDRKGEIDNNTIIIRDFNTLLTVTDISSKHKIKKTIGLLIALDQMEHSTHQQGNTHSSQAHMKYSPE